MADTDSLNANAILALRRAIHGYEQIMREFPESKAMDFYKFQSANLTRALAIVRAVTRPKPPTP